MASSTKPLALLIIALCFITSVYAQKNIYQEAPNLTKQVTDDFYVIGVSSPSPILSNGISNSSPSTSDDPSEHLA